MHHDPFDLIDHWGPEKVTRMSPNLDLAQSRVLAAITARGFQPDEALRDQRSAA